MTGGRLVGKILAKYGVKNLHTLCGGHIMEIYEGCADYGVRVVDYRHEQAAVFAADAAGRVSGIPGVAAVTAGPGVMNGVTGVANAWRAQSPLILIGGQAPTFLRGKGALQELDHVSVLKPITKWAVQVPDVSSIPDYLSRAFRAAMDGVPGPVYIEIPMDILFSPSEDISALEYSFTRPRASEKTVQEILSAIRRSQKPVIIMGSQIAWSSFKDKVKDIVDKLGIPVFLNGLARGCLGKEHPLLFRFCRKQALANADLVILAGVPLDFRLDYGRQIRDEAFLVRLDLDPEELRRNREGNISEVCDPLSALAGVAERFDNSNRFEKWVDELKSYEDVRRRNSYQEASQDKIPINPLRLCRDLADFIDSIGEKVIIVGDGGDIVGSAAYFLKPTHLGGWLDPGPLGTLGVGAPFAIGAKLEKPDHEVFVLFGDGAFGFNAFEYDTAVRLEIPFVGVIGLDGAWTQIKRAQVPMYGRAIATDLAYTRYDKVVEALGGYGEYVENPSDIIPALSRALEFSRKNKKPSCVNVRIGETEFRKGSISM
ncbi:Acetolactate synthase large subunit IlvG [bacterium HR19]|nr:Acetolactate synthase large subunit IlvG [bacterium HR19]